MISEEDDYSVEPKGMNQEAAPVVETDNRPKQQPRYNVVLWNDEDHTYEYVIHMLKELFGFNIDRGFKLATKVDNNGRVICLTTTLEHAEFKRDQIHAYGKDELIANCQGSMYATIEPVD